MRLRSIDEVTGEPVLHREKAILDVSVVVDEIFDAELCSLVVAENDPEPIRHWLAGRFGKHLGVAAELEGVIRFGRFREFCIPYLILFRGGIQHDEIGKSGEPSALERTLIDDGVTFGDRSLRPLEGRLVAR